MRTSYQVPHANTLNVQSHHTRSMNSFTITTQSTTQSMAKTPVKYLTQIEAQSSSSVEMISKEKEELLMRIFMMTLQIERKDTVVKNLLDQLKNTSMSNSLQITEDIYRLQQQIIKSKRYAEDLEFKNSQLEITVKQLQSNKKFNHNELQDKIIFLQAKNKQLQLKRIEIQSEYQKLITQSKMLNYKLVNIESTERGKSREVQNQMEKLYIRIDEEKKIANQFKIIIESTHSQIRQLKQNQQKILRQFDERVRTLQRQLNHKQDLKKSQIYNSQQTLSRTEQQIERMKQEINFLRKTLNDQQLSFQRKQQELSVDLKKGKQKQSQLFNLRHHNAILNQQNQKKSFQIDNLTKELNKTKQIILDYERNRNQLQINNQSISHKIIVTQQESEAYKARLLRLQSQNESFKDEVRLMKKKAKTTLQINDCNSCKILHSSTSIRSNRTIPTDLNLAQIIQQAQRLHNSNIKIQNMLSKASIERSQRSIIYDHQV